MTPRKKNRTPKRERDQREIDRLQIRNRVMQLLVQHQRLAKNGALEDGLTWTIREIAHHLGYNPDDTTVMPSVREAVHGLLKIGWVQRRGIEWVKTGAGEDSWRAEVRQVDLSISHSEFIDEALTGIDPDGYESSIELAALPGKAPHYFSGDAMASFCDHVEWVKRLAKRLDMTVDEVSSGIITGRVGKCPGTDQQQEHMAVFGPMGDRWQHRCPECSRYLLRKRRKEAKAK